jgi:phosphatidylinositol dimannoside acyltransferase
MNAPQRAQFAPPVSPPAPGAVANWWLRTLFKAARDHRWLIAALRPLARRLPVRCSVKIHDATYANARRLLGANVSERQCRQYAENVVLRFIDFIVDVGRSYGQTPEQMRQRIDSVEGHENYVRARELQRGAIVVTAHMGSFELGLAALTQIEKDVHVVFKRDSMDGFEQIRRSLRQTLGVHEAPIDDGWTTWIRLRDALTADHVVVLQGDRAMPGQRSVPVKIAGGHIRLPLGPVKLAIASGAPIIPIFTLSTGEGRCQVFVERPILVNPDVSDDIAGVLEQIGAVLEKYLRSYPDQWLILDRAFVEDAIH